MEFKHLGRSDLHVSRIAFGCWAMGGFGWGHVDDQESVTAVRRALALGVNFFDTADVYGFGHSEEVLARALGDDRHEVIISTKGGVAWTEHGKTRRDISPRAIVEALEASLRRLKIDCIPLYHVHWPDGRTPIASTIEALVRCREAGKLRWIGCSNFSIVQLEEANCISPIVSLQSPYNLLEREIESQVLPYCGSRNIAMLAYGPLAQGFLSGKLGYDSQFDASDVRSRNPYLQSGTMQSNIAAVARLKALAARLDKTPAQVAIRWVLDEPNLMCAVTGVKTVAQIEENVGAIGWTLTPEDRGCLSGSQICETETGVPLPASHADVLQP